MNDKLQFVHRQPWTSSAACSCLSVTNDNARWLENVRSFQLKHLHAGLQNHHGLVPRYMSDLCTNATVHAHLPSSQTLEPRKWVRSNSISVYLTVHFLQNHMHAIFVVHFMVLPTLEEKSRRISSAIFLPPPPKKKVKWRPWSQEGS